MNEKLSFYNSPKSPSIHDYDNCVIDSVKYLIKKYPNASIFKIGGENIKKGISDVDLLILSYTNIDGNHLYLRNFSSNYIKKGILLHEFFAVDVDTYINLNKITSYNLQPLVYSKVYALPKLKKSSPLFDFYKLSYYLVINYPMNFYAWEKDNKINIRRSLTKLKKLTNFENLFKNVFDEKINFLPQSFVIQLNDTFENYSVLNKREIENQVIDLLYQAQEITNDIFNAYEEYSLKFISIKNEHHLKINGYHINFSDNWRQDLFRDNTYFAPKNLAIFNSIFNQIDPKFKTNIEYSKIETEITEFNEVGQILNNYLSFCDNSNLNQLIVDINFEVGGYNSLKYRIFQLLRNLKRRINIKR